jgi:hypothetical protein
MGPAVSGARPAVGGAGAVEVEGQGGGGEEQGEEGEGEGHRRTLYLSACSKVGQVTKKRFSAYQGGWLTLKCK